MTHQPQISDGARPRLVMSQALQLTAELATSLVPTYADQHAEFGEHLQAARRLRLCAERVIDAAIAVEAEAGATAAEIAAWLALPVEQVEMRLANQRARAAAIDPPRLAEELDAWYARVSGPDAPSDAVSAGLA